MTPEGGVEVLTIDVTEIVGDLSIPCDYDRLYKCGPAAAEWVMIARCECGVSGERLVCPTCKDSVLMDEGGLCCPAGCGFVYVPARHAFTLIEPLNKRA